MDESLVAMVTKFTTLSDEGAREALEAHNFDVEETIKSEMAKFKVSNSSGIDRTDDERCKSSHTTPTNNQKVFHVFRKFLDGAEREKRSKEDGAKKSQT